jgi:hypothetical protein
MQVILSFLVKHLDENFGVWITSIVQVKWFKLTEPFSKIMSNLTETLAAILCKLRVVESTIFVTSNTF